MQMQMCVQQIHTLEHSIENLNTDVLILNKECVTAMTGVILSDVFLAVITRDRHLSSVQVQANTNTVGV